MGDKMSEKEKKAPASPEEKCVYLFMEEVTQETCKELISFIFTMSWQRPRPKCLQ